jgi:hypothetical protein
MGQNIAKLKRRLESQRKCLERIRVCNHSGVTTFGKLG